MNKLLGMLAFVRVVESGGFTSAAKRLGHAAPLNARGLSALTAVRDNNRDTKFYNWRPNVQPRLPVPSSRGLPDMGRTRSKPTLER